MRLASNRTSCHKVFPSLTSPISRRAFGELSRIIRQVEAEEGATLDLIVTPAQSQALFQMHDVDPSVDLVSQLIEGNLPDYKAIILTTHNTRIVLYTAVFLEAVRVAYLFARDSANIVRLSVQPGSDLEAGTMQVQATPAEQGDDRSELQAGSHRDRLQRRLTRREQAIQVTWSPKPQQSASLSC